MTRAASTLLFMLAATLVNLLLTGGFFFGLLFIYGLTLGRFLRLGSSAYVIFAAFIAAIVLSILVYNAILKLLRKRFDLEKRLGLR
ncbi:MAG TPA: leader peptide processing enzyme [Rectinemataceae bacterium]|nr:leader peptide processing enzyme [Rectinemataceae bacterium]